MPLPYRKLTACMTRFNGHSLLIDCGEGTQVGIKQRGWSVKPLDAICFTHFHADHVSGLPGLLLTLGNAERKEPLLIIGPKGVEKVVNSLRIIAPELPFPIHFYELKEKEHVIQMNGYTIEAFQVKHNVLCYGYNMVIPRAGKFDMQKAKENQIPMKHRMVKY
jgi:ribonuclease Z